MDELLPTEDINNAIRYAQQFIIKHRYDTQHVEMRWDLPPYYIEEHVPDESFHIPPALKKDFKLYTLKFDQGGCNQLSCFRYMYGGQPCPPYPLSLRLRIAGQVYPACQSACRKNLIDGHIPFIDETQFVDGKCKRKNTLFKKWCLFPETRSDVPQDVPPFRFDDSTQTCHFTPEYCTRYGLQYDQVCTRSDAQAFFEDYLIGQTIYRAFTIEKFKARRKKRSIEEQIVKEVSLDIGIDLSFWSARQLALKSIPLYSTPALKMLIANMETMVGKNIAKHVITSAVIHSVKAGITAQIAIKTAACLGTAATVVGAVLLGIQLIGFVTDIIDPYRLNDLVDQKFLDDIKQAFDNQFHSILQGELEIDPLSVMAVLSKNEYNEAERVLFITKLAIYFSHLEVNSRGETINYISGPSLEEYLHQWVSALHHVTPAELEVKMDGYFF